MPLAGIPETKAIFSRLIGPKGDAPEAPEATMLAEHIALLATKQSLIRERLRVLTTRGAIQDRARLRLIEHGFVTQGWSHAIARRCPTRQTGMFSMPCSISVAVGRGCAAGCWAPGSSGAGHRDYLGKCVHFGIKQP